MVGLVCSQTLKAQEGDAGQAGAFMRYGVGGRALGMGRAFVAVANDATGPYWNPAGMVGAKRLEVTSMYSNLYFDSQFAHFGVVLPRLARYTRSWFVRALFGPATAWGFGWIGLSVSDFEQRNNRGMHLGNFGIGEQAFFFSWARESVGRWGILRYGLSMKFVTQNFSGLQDHPSMAFGDLARDWSRGLDIGITFQPINAPLFRIFTLRYLLPLRLGLTVQNINIPDFLPGPGWEMSDQSRDLFPTTLRWGLSYRWTFRDWIPVTWKGLRNLFGRSYILVAYDQEFYLKTGDSGEGFDRGHYFGVEGNFPLFSSKVTMFPRFGFNSRTEGVSFGFGLSLPFASSAAVRIDYAYGLHPYLSEDNRFFLTIQMGGDRGVNYFRESVEREDIRFEERQDYLLRILSEYPNESVMNAAGELASTADSSLSWRYYDLTGGLGRASWLFNESKSLLRLNKIVPAQRKADEAAKEFAPVFFEPEYDLTDENLLDYAESLIIAQHIEEATDVLIEIEDHNLRYYFLRGVCAKSINQWDTAIEMFRNGVQRYEREQNLQSMVSLSFLGLAEALVQEGLYESALMTLDVLLENYRDRLNANYPRYPLIEDDYIVDDAQFLAGICRTMLSHDNEGVSELMKTLRFYPQSEYGRLLGLNAEALIEVLQTANWARLDGLIQQLLNTYIINHQWPPNR